MKKYFVLVLISFFIASCSSSPEVITSENDKIENVKRAAVILRTPQNTLLYQEDILSNMTKWIAGYKKIKPVTFISTSKESLSEYMGEENAFYQIDSDGKFLKYKSIGTIKQFVKENENILKETMLSDNSDILVFYEVKAAYSLEMENMLYNSVIVVLDKELNIVFLDHIKKYESVSSLDKPIKDELLNIVSNRFIDFLVDFDMLEQY